MKGEPLAAPLYCGYCWPGWPGAVPETAAAPSRENGDGAAAPAAGGAAARASVEELGTDAGAAGTGATPSVGCWDWLPGLSNSLMSISLPLAACFNLGLVCISAESHNESGVPEYSGRRTRKVAPWPSSLSTSTVPLCAATSAATMARPRPVLT